MVALTGMNIYQVKCFHSLPDCAAKSKIPVSRISLSTFACNLMNILHLRAGFEAGLSFGAHYVQQQPTNCRLGSGKAISKG